MTTEAGLKVNKTWETFLSEKFDGERGPEQTAENDVMCPSCFSNYETYARIKETIEEALKGYLGLDTNTRLNRLGLSMSYNQSHPIFDTFSAEQDKRARDDAQVAPIVAESNESHFSDLELDSSNCSLSTPMQFSESPDCTAGQEYSPVLMTDLESSTEVESDDLIASSMESPIPSPVPQVAPSPSNDHLGIESNVIWKHFYSVKSVCKHGTLYQLRNLIGRTNVKINPSKSFDE
uniref:Uncharacterized protein n=1 Tax=Amphimedon queenslandica TaxID=400682 RepID=A0A1X7VSK9_AMPQE